MSAPVQRRPILAAPLAVATVLTAPGSAWALSEALPLYRGHFVSMQTGAARIEPSASDFRPTARALLSEAVSICDLPGRALTPYLTEYRGIPWSFTIPRNPNLPLASMVITVSEPGNPNRRIDLTVFVRGKEGGPSIGAPVTCEVVMKGLDSREARAAVTGRYAARARVIASGAGESVWRIDPSAEWPDEVVQRVRVRRENGGVVVVTAEFSKVSH